VVQTLPSFADGTLMHYVNIGSNNPNQFAAPYNVYNGLTNTGKMLVHEAGHYLGLRHVWGDGDCSFDDYVLDTPKASAASQYNCNPTLNTCVDTINGQDLPNMIENYMDYSNAPCQNAFTKGQVDIMRAVLENQRANLVINGVEGIQIDKSVLVYPNPTNGEIVIEFTQELNVLEVNVINIQGVLLSSTKASNAKRILVNISGPTGVYLVQIVTSNKTITKKVMKN
jgi:hypothetical protein